MMNEVLHANIFFLIATIATVIFCIFFCFILYQVWKITRLVRAILERIEAASEVMADDVSNIRQSLAQGGLISRLLNFVLGESAQKRRKKRARSSD